MPPRKKKQAAAEDEGVTGDDNVHHAADEEAGDEDFHPPQDDAEDEDEDDDQHQDDDEDDDFEKEPPKKKSKKSTSTSEDSKPEPKKKAGSSKAKKSSGDGGDEKKTTKKSASKGSAAKGEKPKAIKSESEAKKVILQYLTEQNRPYSVQNVVDNLHGVVKKTMAQKCLDALVADEKISCKENKKSKVYMLNQSDIEIPPQEELDAMDEEIKTLTEGVGEMREEIRSLQTEKKRLDEALTNEQLDQQIGSLDADIATKSAKLKRLKEETTPVDPQEKAKVTKEHESFKLMYKKRKRMAKEILDTLADKMEKKPAALIEEIGVDTDEAVGFRIEEFH